MSDGMTKIELVGALRYSYKGEKYEQNVHYLVRSDRAKLLLRLTTGKNGFYVFREVGKTFSPVASQTPERQERELPTVDTTKTQAQQYDDAIAGSVKEISDEGKPVVVQGEGRVDDISEDEALAALLAEDAAEKAAKKVTKKKTRKKKFKEEGTPI